MMYKTQRSSCLSSSLYNILSAPENCWTRSAVFWKLPPYQSVTFQPLTGWASNLDQRRELLMSCCCSMFLCWYQQYWMICTYSIRATPRKYQSKIKNLLRMLRTKSHCNETIVTHVGLRVMPGGRPITCSGLRSLYGTLVWDSPTALKIIMIMSIIIYLLGNNS